MGEVHWKPKEDLEPVICTCDCGEIYWTPVIENGDNGVETIGPIASGDQSFNPRNNQAGSHADDNAINPDGPGVSEGPGNGNTDWSPIWPG